MPLHPQKERMSAGKHRRLYYPIRRDGRFFSICRQTVNRLMMEGIDSDFLCVENAPQRRIFWKKNKMGNRIAREHGQLMQPFLCLFLHILIQIAVHCDSHNL